jgi:hypothetical protein
MARQLRGLWQAEYGEHGTEIVEVEVHPCTGGTPSRYTHPANQRLEVVRTYSTLSDGTGAALLLCCERWSAAVTLQWRLTLVALK